jgi:5-methylcytosine-specific restriction endonuclease McrA
MNVRYTCLVLNRLWIPVHQVFWHKAINLLLNDHAHSLDVDFVQHDWNQWLEYSNSARSLAGDYDFVHSVKHTIAVPEILTLCHYDKLPNKDVHLTRQNIFSLYNNHCAYCNKKFRYDLLSVDHIIPKSVGGKTTWQNCLPACKPCNGKKANRTPVQAKMPLHFQPKEPQWHGSFHKLISTQNRRPNWDKFLEAINIKVE